jgi:hypothetical protein
MKKLLLVLFMLPTIVFGRKFYVSELGNDAYTITEAQNPNTPWKTLSKVRSNMANGDSALFAKGSKFSGTMSLSSKSNLYFGVYGTGADPLFWGNGSTIGALFTLNNCTNITFYGWNISDTTISFTDRYIQAKIQTVFQFESGSINNVIRKCRMDRIGYGAYYTTSSGSNTMDSSDIGNLRMIKNTPQSVNPDDDYGGVPVQISSSNNTITNNYFHDCYAASYDYTFDGGGIEFFEEGVVIQNNVIAYNTFINGNGTFEFGSSNDGVVNNLIQNNKIYYNKIINNNTVVYINNNGQYKTRVTNLQFYNNVIVQNIPNANPSGSSGIQFSLATADANSGIIVLKNNILYVTNGADIMRSGQFTSGQLTHTNNIFTVSGGNLNFTLDATERSTAIQYWTNTTGINPLNWDFNLLSTSYAINNGVPIAGLTRDFIGNAVPNPPDIGILEYGSAVPPTPCTFTFGPWSDCINGSQTRTYTASPVGCFGAPSSSDLQRTCTSPPCTFVYGPWSECINNVQTRSYTSSPVGCSGFPPANEITRVCVSPVVTGRRFYFSSTTGNDSYTTTQAQNPATPWKTLAKLNSLSAIAAPGDTFAFKRGDMFANGSQGGVYTTTGSVKWYGGGYEGRNFPSGTAQNPIVFTYYGDMNLERPNLLYPNPSTVRSNERNVLAFANVSYIVIDGIQFNDTRFPINDKRSGAFTTTGLWFGDSGYCSDADECKCNNITVKNCNFSNVAYGIVAFVRDFKIENNTFSNFKSTGWITDTLGNNDIGADPMIISGSKYRITNNRITGSWAYCNPNTSSSGLLGGALETINNFDSSFIAYNTFIDCSGGMEFGTNLPGGVQGPNDDTICFNKFINCSNITFLNTSGQFATQAKNIRFWNNFFVEGSKSRMSGYEAGGDAMGDGQTYANTGFIFWPPYPINKSTRYPAEQNFQNAWRPIASGVTTGQVADTVFDIRNNVFWINNGFFAKYGSDRPKIFYRNNAYHLVSGYQGAVGGFTPTSLGPGTSLATGERILNGKFIIDSSSVYPQNWDMHILSDTCYIATGGTNVGLTKDFSGADITGVTPFIGIYKPSAGLPISASVSVGTITCFEGSTTAVVTATGGVPPYSGTGTFSVIAGSRSFTVSDAAGGSTSITVNIPQPTDVVGSVAFAPITVIGGTTTVTISATGGTGTKVYSIDGSAYQSGSIFTGVAFGPHSVSVRDANNCTHDFNFNVTYNNNIRRSRLKFININF